MSFGGVARGKGGGLSPRRAVKKEINRINPNCLRNFRVNPGGGGGINLVHGRLRTHRDIKCLIWKSISRKEDHHYFNPFVMISHYNIDMNRMICRYSSFLILKLLKFTSGLRARQSPQQRKAPICSKARSCLGLSFRRPFPGKSLSAWLKDESPENKWKFLESVEIHQSFSSLSRPTRDNFVFRELPYRRATCKYCLNISLGIKLVNHFE